jgi:rubrerythrin
MADPCIGCGKTVIHPFEGLVRSIMDGSIDHVHGKPPLPDLHGACEACGWHLRHRVIPEYCPQCGTPTRVFVLEEQ